MLIKFNLDFVILCKLVEIFQKQLLFISRIDSQFFHFFPIYDFFQNLHIAHM